MCYHFWVIIFTKVNYCKDHKISHWGVGNQKMGNNRLREWWVSPHEPQVTGSGCTLRLNTKDNLCTRGTHKLSLHFF